MASFVPWRQHLCCRRLTRCDVRSHPPAVLNRSAPLVVLFFFSLFLFDACQHSTSKTAIEFTKIPVADVGGPDKMDAIEGRATGVRPGQQLVLYARSEGRWWIQPFAREPFTKIQSDATWKNETHLGMEYAAMVVDPGETPPPTTEVLPSRGGGIAAVAVVKGQSPESSPAPPKTLHFSGYDWIVRSGLSYRGRSRNSFDPANAWTDENAALHLRIAKNQDGWTCAEVQTTRSLGYGTYMFVVRDISHLEPSAVLTLFTWDGTGTDENRRELDTEISRWGYRENENAQYVVQPYYIPTNVLRFNAPAGVLTHAFHWEPARVTFTTYAGSQVSAPTRPLNQHVFTSGVPKAGGEVARINLYLFGKGDVPLQHENEIVVEAFKYYP